MATRSRKAPRKATAPKAIPTGTTISYGDEKVEHLLGPHVPIPLYFRHHRHWCGPEHSGEPRPMDRQFLELEREGVECLYRILNALVEEGYPHGSEMRRPTTAPNLGRWGDMHRERAEVNRAWAVNNGAVVHRIGPMLPTDPKGYTAPYGDTYVRAHHQLVHKVMVPDVVTEEEAERERVELGILTRAGDVYFRTDPAQSTKATAEEVGYRWAEVYAAEVRHLLGDDPNDERLAAFARLHANVKGYTVGSKEGSRVMERMKSTGMGAEVLAAFGRIREHLNALLYKVAEEHATPETMENGRRITWNDSASLLAYLLTELIEADYIVPPPNGRRTGRNGNRAAVADMVYQLLDIRDRDTGQPVTREYFRSLLRPNSPDRDSRPELFRIRPRVAPNEPT